MMKRQSGFTVCSINKPRPEHSGKVKVNMEEYATRL